LVETCACADAANSAAAATVPAMDLIKGIGSCGSGGAYQAYAEE
jgi:hypothetical protein